MNIGEIARRAGVSRSTVFCVLSRKRTVSEGTRQRIQAVIDELDYRPNASARALKEGRSRTLGLAIPPGIAVEQVLMRGSETRGYAVAGWSVALV
ncbi:helix-turn-helix transcriptional regulator [Micromonospora rifamycinica]|uniref:Regulatory protein, lacI family n=2 Tax=Micromonospora TaxID=1873 RepID=A0A1C4XED9_9ACTN|nr:helix-turn-helix transcriptional regulator [Micromonospora matsumotoense]SCF06923.1 regulatory protein, lacI family [Micromonospora matsumotoense]